MQPTAPEVSVCMPAYNVARYIADSIASIQRQTLQNWELVVVNDGSKDQTPDIVQQLAAADPRIVLINQQNQGVSAAAMRAIEAARSDLLARLDSDDLAMPERLERQVKFLKENPDCVAVGSNVRLIDDEGLPLFVMPDIQLGNDRIVETLLAGGWPILQTAATFRKSAILKAGGYRRELSLHEDHDLFLRLAELGRLENLPEVLSDYRQRPSGLTFTESPTGAAVMSRILAEARQRRGLPDLPVNRSSTAPAIHASLLQRYRHWAWMSLKAKNLAAARKYAWKGYKQAPFSPQSMKLLACTLRGH